MYEAIIKRKIARLRYIGVENTTIKDKNVINRLLGKVEYGNIRRGDWLMNVYNLNVKVYLLKDIILNKVQQSIASAIDLALSKNKYYLQFHNDISYKFYCNNGLYPLEPFTKEDAIEVLNVIHRWQEKAFAEYELHFIHASDEWYLLADMELPKEESYDGYLQLENGVGMLRLFMDEFEDGLQQLMEDKK